MLLTIIGGQYNVSADSHNFKIDAGVAANNLNIILTFDLKNAVTAAWEQVLSDGLLLRVRLRERS